LIGKYASRKRKGALGQRTSTGPSRTSGRLPPPPASESLIASGLGAPIATPKQPEETGAHDSSLRTPVTLGDVSVSKNLFGPGVLDLPFQVSSFRRGRCGGSEPERAGRARMRGASPAGMTMVQLARWMLPPAGRLGRPQQAARACSPQASRGPGLAAGTAPPLAAPGLAFVRSSEEAK
jgi:hypothetical protein